MKIAEALANKRGDKMGRAGRPDVHTAARNILFDVVDGVVPLYWAPPEPLELAQQLQQRDAERYARLLEHGREVVRREKEAQHGQPRSAQPVPAPSTPTGSDGDRDHKGSSNGEAKKRKRRQATEIKGTTAQTAHPPVSEA